MEFGLVIFMERFDIAWDMRFLVEFEEFYAGVSWKPSIGSVVECWTNGPMELIGTIAGLWQEYASTLDFLHVIECLGICCLIVAFSFTVT